LSLEIELRVYELRPLGQGPKAAATWLAWEGSAAYLTVDGAAYRGAADGGVEVLAEAGEVGARATVDPGTGRVARADEAGVVRLDGEVVGRLGEPALRLRFLGDGARLVALLPTYVRVLSGPRRP
jgi:hypothetical protein